MEALGPAAANIITDAGQLNSDRFSAQAVEKTYTDAINAGASPALAAALATTSSRAFSEIEGDSDLASFEQQTADIFRDVTGGTLNVGSAQTAMLSEQDYGLFDSEQDRQDFYSGIDPTSSTIAEQSTGISTGRSFDPFTQATFDAEAGVRLGGKSSSYDLSDLFADQNATRVAKEKAAAEAAAARSRRSFTPRVSTPMGTLPDGPSLTDRGPTVKVDSPTRNVTVDSPLGSRDVRAGETVSFSSNDGSTTTVTGKSYTDASGNTRSGAFVDNNNDGVQQSNERSTVTSSSGSVVTSRDGTPVTSRSQDEVGGDSGGDDSGSYCCTKMVDHELWRTRREFAMMHKWHREQPQWWRDGYDVWGNVVAETLLAKKTKFWTSVMQSFYDHHVKKQPLTFKSALANAIIYPGVFVVGMVAKLNGRHVHEI